MHRKEKDKVSVKRIVREYEFCKKIKREWSKKTNHGNKEKHFCLKNIKEQEYWTTSKCPCTCLKYLLYILQSKHLYFSTYSAWVDSHWVVGKMPQMKMILQKLPSRKIGPNEIFLWFFAYL